MAASIDYDQSYQQAYKAYVQRNYDEAATLVDKAVISFPDDPNTHLLRGHVYYVLQKFDTAVEEYKKVLQLSDDPEITGFARNGLEDIAQFQQPQASVTTATAYIGQVNLQGAAGSSFQDQGEDFADVADFDASAFNLDAIGDNFPSLDGLEEISSIDSPFDMPTDTTVFGAVSDSLEYTGNKNPFSISTPITTDRGAAVDEKSKSDFEIPAFWQEDLVEEVSISESNDVKASNQEETATEKSSGKNPKDKDKGGEPTPRGGDRREVMPFKELSETVKSDDKEPTPRGGDRREVMPVKELSETVKSDDKEPTPRGGDRREFSPFEQSALPPSGSFDDSELSGISLEESIEGLNFSVQTFEDETLMIGETQLKKELNNQNSLNTFGYTSSDAPLPNSKSNNNLNFGAAFGEKDFFSYPPQKEQNTTEVDDNFDFEAFESAFGADSFASLENSSPSVSSFNESKTQARNIEFFDEFDEFDDLGNLSHIDITGDNSFSNTKLRSGPFDTSSIPTRSKSLENPKSINLESDRDDELFSITASQESVPVFTQSDVSKIEPTVNVEQGFFAPIENASLENKQWFIAGAVGAISALVVATISFTAANLSEPGQRASIRNTGWAMALAAGVAGFGTAGIMGNLTLRQIRRTTRDLQSQFDSVRQGNLNVQATVYSEDELGQLAAGFNEMARVILTTTSEAKRKADEQEEAKESLQRQVIRLLDDVEGAARGDLTVQAEVSADVLGAVADAFNLTIQNLRDIVQQVKAAAREVTKGATNSETFARALSSDALRQAEELAVTLNSVQVMTDSIQRVAEAAREAEAVARDASSIALKGGEAVENTVAGILEIRETVAETTRKVKRLAESSQEISKIVALISQIASRTNLLALNASIEAARAGEAGRGFAIVADEVRQLADKSAKSLKEIEQIVMQIQSETGSVMTAMEEGTQQVIKGTKLAEEAKRSLENIIQVANRIDILVRSITADTVEQTETSRAVAQVMQSVELTAQETSQEAQRVSGALQYLVSVSRDLIASVERFRVEITESR